MQIVTFSKIAEDTVYQFFAENVRRKIPTETAFLEASVFTSSDFIGTFKTPDYDTVSHYDSIAPSLNDVSVRGNRSVQPGAKFLNCVHKH